MPHKQFDNLDIPINPLNPPVEGTNGYTGFNPRSEILQKGWNKFQSRALESEILIEHDFTFTVRDGAKLCVDIFRPTGLAEKVPALICWSPFGKQFNGLSSLALMTPWSLGIPEGTLSGLEKFESIDPADWVPRGYAVLNVDSRGTGDSDGTMAIMGTQEAEDAYDVIEAVARLDWCSGRVAMVGNSHLAIIQWFVAALKPPSLVAIAPWEACGDLFREQFARGGIYAGDLFDNLITKHLIHGRHGIESFRGMYNKIPESNAWWNDKRPDMTKIDIPTYMTGTWTNTMHGMGALRGWKEVATHKKWLRFHATQEWYDLWGSQQAKAELLQFLDFYLKDKQNNWEMTPHLRLACLRFGDVDAESNIVEDKFPLARTQYRKMYLSPKSRLSLEPPMDASSISYDSLSRTEFAQFTYTFPETTRLIGVPKAVLYMSCKDLDDMDVYVCLRKLSKSGEAMLNLNIPWAKVPVNSIAEIPEDKRTEVILYMGPVGIMRASHREIDASKSVHENWPYHPHEREAKIPPGDVVKLEIGIWAMGIEYEAGESIRMQVSGRNQGMHFHSEDFNNNKGSHFIHWGGRYPSHLILPFTCHQ